jgi:squalene-hopene/tetraprenyl-beta-curcumene cyclase
MSRRVFIVAIITACIAVFSIASVHAAGPDAKTYEQCVSKGVDFLTKQQAEDGSFNAQPVAAVTALCATALMRNGRTPEDPVVAKSLKFIEQFVQPDGGIYGPDSQVRNYETCLAMVCLKEANKAGRYDKILADADKFVRDKQWDDSESIDQSDLRWGGAGYGGRNNRPDLSNTSFLMDALKATGAGADDPAVKNALVFVSRCQNLESEYNTSPFAAKINDGGFYYTVAAGGASMAAAEPGQPEGALRSYGSMTYSGLKSMIYAGLTPNDPRVKAAVDWAKKNYDLSSNPGMGDAGLYYYYHTFSKALDALGQGTLEDAKGVAHDWRRELVDELAKRQQADGSWVNSNKRFMENNNVLVTGFALLTLSNCKGK